MSRKAWIVLGCVVAVILAFFVVSLCLASAHGQDVVTEWQSWFGLLEEAEEVVEQVPSVDETVEATMKLVA